jgi:hypothetical protein
MFRVSALLSAVCLQCKARNWSKTGPKRRSPARTRSAESGDNLVTHAPIAETPGKLLRV